jgi:2-dehydropantoate 2-reductase
MAWANDRMATTLSRPPQDIVRGRPTEIDSLNGPFAMRAEQCGLKAPANATLAALVKLRERVRSGA